MTTRDMRSTTRLLTVAEVACAMGVSTVTVRRWIAARVIAHVRLGGRSVRVPAAECDRLIAAGLTPVRSRARADSERAAAR